MYISVERAIGRQLVRSYNILKYCTCETKYLPQIVLRYLCLLIPPFSLHAGLQYTFEFAILASLHLVLVEVELKVLVVYVVLYRTDVE